MRAVLSLAVAGVVLAVAGCGGGGAGADGGSTAPTGGRPHVVVTTSMLGDIVRNVVGDQAAVEVVMPAGTDPHEFAPSARQAEEMQGADLLVVNGAGLEQSMHGVVGHAKRVFTFADHVQLRKVAGGQVDPHLWNDPHEVAAAVDPLGAAVADLPGVDAATVRRQAAAYRTTLDALDAEISSTLAPLPAARRTLVTNHDSFGYFAARYDLRVIGTVIPSLTTSAASSAADLEQLADVVRREKVPAVFAETTQPAKLADALAAEVGGRVRVVELYTESLGPPGSGADTYVGMMRTDARRIAGALS